MRIETAFPPNYRAIITAFPHVARTYGVVFAWGDTIFNPHKRRISKFDEAHEEVHFARQAAMGGPVAWWQRYLADTQFRFIEEAHAHITEYRKVQEMEQRRNARRFYLKQIAERLSGPLYGGLITKENAIRLIKKGEGAMPDFSEGEAA